MAMSSVRGRNVEREKLEKKDREKKWTRSAADIKTNYLNSPTHSLSLSSPALRLSLRVCTCVGGEGVRRS